MHRSTISLALNTDTPSRYAATLVRITKHFADYQIESETVTIHRAKHKGKT